MLAAEGKLLAASNPSLPGKNDQISSVTNGHIGCSRPSVDWITNSAVSDAARFEATSSPYRRALIASRYQSQNSFQMNAYSVFVAAENRNAS